MTKSVLEDVNDFQSHSQLRNKHRKIKAAFGVDIAILQQKDLDNAFLSALVARLYLR